jgi:hypothetical protein
LIRNIRAFEAFMQCGFISGIAGVSLRGRLRVVMVQVSALVRVITTEGLHHSDGVARGGVDQGRGRGDDAQGGAVGVRVRNRVRIVNNHILIKS